MVEKDLKKFIEEDSKFRKKQESANPQWWKEFEEASAADKNAKVLPDYFKEFDDVAGDWKEFELFKDFVEKQALATFAKKVRTVENFAEFFFSKKCREIFLLYKLIEVYI
jgi:hypothetical protein